MRRTFDRVVSGQVPAEVALDRFGQFVEALLKDHAINLRNPPNAPLTRFVKQSANPLVDTGRMIASIRYIVRRGSGPIAGPTRRPRRTS
ncbi:hypothetical protein D3C72_1506560 [compost metagenome]